MREAFGGKFLERCVQCLVVGQLNWLCPPAIFEQLGAFTNKDEIPGVKSIVSRSSSQRGNVVESETMLA
jgi:hypothetical protein